MKQYFAVVGILLTVAVIITEVIIMAHFIFKYW